MNGTNLVITNTTSTASSIIGAPRVLPRTLNLWRDTLPPVSDASSDTVEYATVSDLLYVTGAGNTVSRTAGGSLNSAR